MRKFASAPGMPLWIYCCTVVFGVAGVLRYSSYAIVARGYVDLASSILHPPGVGSAKLISDGTPTQRPYSLLSENVFALCFL